MTEISVVRSVPSERAVRCDVCGSATLAGVCHHCGKGLCESHKSDQLGDPSEFRGLRLRQDKKQDTGIHCRHCAHLRVTARDLVATLGGLVFISFLAVALPLPTAITLMLVVIGALAGFGIGVIWLADHQGNGVRPCPSFPRIERERTVESYVFRAELLPNGRWSARLIEIHGAVRANLRFMPDDVRRIGRYRRKHRIAEGAPVDVSAGYFVAHTAPPHAAKGLNAGVPDQVCAAEVRVSTAQLPYLDTGDATPTLPTGAGTSLVPSSHGPTTEVLQASSVLAWEAPFTANVGYIDRRAPIEIVPILVTDGRRRVLEVRVRVVDTSSPLDTPFAQEVTGTGLVPRQLRHLELHVPLDLGEVRPLGLAPTVRTSPDVDGGSRREIRWESVDADGLLSGRSPTDLFDEPFRIEFGHPIEPQTVLRGSVAVVFQGSFAGIRDTSWYDPTGRLVPSRVSDSFSVVELRFEFPFASVPYEESLLVIDRDILSSGPIIGRVSADHATALLVSEHLTKAGFYIFSLAESSISHVNLDPESRVWQLEGRHFDGVAPVDFQLKLEGVGSVVDKGPGYGLRSATLNIQAVYNSEDRRKSFEAVAQRIEAVAREALIQCSGLGATPRLSQGEGV